MRALFTALVSNELAAAARSDIRRERRPRRTFAWAAATGKATKKLNETGEAKVKADVNFAPVRAD